MRKIEHCVLTMISISILFLACTASETTPAASKFVTVLIENKTTNPIRIATDKNFFNVGTSQRIVDSGTDTVEIASTRMLFYYISHKDSFADTVLAGPGDTIIINATLSAVKSHVRSATKDNEKVTELLGLSLKTPLSQRIDSLSSLFYQIDDRGKPLEAYDEYSRFIKYPLRINRKALADKKDDFQDLLVLLDENFRESKRKVTSNAGVSKRVAQVVSDKLQIEYFSKLTLFHQMTGSSEILAKIVSPTFINDDLLMSPYAGRILGQYLTSYVIRKKPDFSRSKEHIHYDEAYDNAEKYLSGDLLKYAKFMSLDRMADFEEPVTEIEKRYEVFSKEFNDARLNKILSNKLGLMLNEFKDNTNDVFLLTHAGTSKPLQEVLKAYRGEMIYIDFWASWCMPCRDAMPDAKILKREFEGQKVRFIYLSIDKNKESWLRAHKAESLNDLTSFLILNQQSASLLKNIKLTSIPKYILFDKSGKLVHPDAPGPKGSAIRELLNDGK